MNLEIRANTIGRVASFKDKITEIRNHDSGTRKKLLLSLGLGAVTIGVAWGVMPVVALKGSGLVENLAPVALDNGLALGLGYAVNIGASLVNLNQERRLLQNKQIEVSQDFPATAVYHSLGKLDSLKEKRKERSITAVCFPAITSLITSAAIKDSAFLSIVALAPQRIPELVVLKSGQGVFNLIQSIAAEVALQTKGREKEKVEGKTKELHVLYGGNENIASNGVVFAPATVNETEPK